MSDKASTVTALQVVPVWGVSLILGGPPSPQLLIWLTEQLLASHREPITAEELRECLNEYALACMLSPYRDLCRMGWGLLQQKRKIRANIDRTAYVWRVEGGFNATIYAYSVQHWEDPIEAVQFYLEDGSSILLKRPKFKPVQPSRRCLVLG